MTTYLEAAIRKEHFRAELQRLNEGWAGCGCSDCQQLYGTLDHSKYGTRVSYLDSVVVVGEDESLHRDRTRVTEPKVSTDGVGSVTAQNKTQGPSDSAKTHLDAAIEKLAGKKLTTREIADKLYYAGFDVSHMTVARHLKRAGQ